MCCALSSIPPMWRTGDRGPPLVDEDWPAVCRAICKGVVGAEREKLHHKFVKLNRAVNFRHPSGNSRAKTLWNAREAEEKGDAYHDQTSEQNIVNRDTVRQALWDKLFAEANAGSG